MSNSKLTHLDDDGKLQMVDVGGKSITKRTAIAKGEIQMLPSTLTLIERGDMKKGDVLTAAKIAGIQAAKKTSELIPLCHPLSIDQVEITFILKDEMPGIEIISQVSTDGKTGVEMEALTAVSVAALTIYDMAKAVEKTMRITNIRLVEKHGGLSGDVLNE